jgi:hypothetical protein
MINTHNIKKVNESTTRHLSTPKGLSVFTVTTLLTYKTNDDYTGFLVQVKDESKSSK